MDGKMHMLASCAELAHGVHVNSTRSAGSCIAVDCGVGGGGAGCMLHIEGEPPSCCCGALPFASAAWDAAAGWPFCSAGARMRVTDPMPGGCQTPPSNLPPFPPSLLLSVSCCSAAVTAVALLTAPPTGPEPGAWPFRPAAGGERCILLLAGPPGCFRFADAARAAGGCASARGSYCCLPGDCTLCSAAAVPAGIAAACG